MIDPDTPCLLGADSEGRGEIILMTTIVMKMTEILLKVLTMGSPWREGVGLQTDPKLKTWKEPYGFSFFGEVGFHDIKEASWNSPSGFSSFFAPCRARLNLSHPLPHQI